MSGVKIETIGEAVDRLVTVPMSNWTILKGLPLMELYDTARKKAGMPLTLAAAKSLAEKVNPGDNVIFLTGFVIPHFQKAETDGPVGSAALARSLDLGLGAVSYIFTEELLRDAVAASFSGAGLHVSDLAGFFDTGRGRRVVVEGFPLDHEQARVQAENILDKLQPAAVIAVERPGWNEKGIHHSGAGFNVSPYTAKVDYIFEGARKRGILTIGIGDLGNEMGMGYIADKVKELVPHGSQCLCGCGAGIAAASEPDLGIICNISNWGAYGVAACLAALSGELDVLHDPDTERFMIRESVRGGQIDPVSGLHRPCVDGESEDTNAYIVQMLRNIVTHKVRESIFTSGYRKIWTEKQKGGELK